MGDINTPVGTLLRELGANSLRTLLQGDPRFEFPTHTSVALTGDAQEIGDGCRDQGIPPNLYHKMRILNEQRNNLVHDVHYNALGEQGLFSREEYKEEFKECMQKLVEIKNKRLQLGGGGGEQ